MIAASQQAAYKWPPQLRHITCGRVYSYKPHLIAKFDLIHVKQHQLRAGTWPRQVWDRHLG